MNGNKLIVLVDDSEPIRFALGELLSASGYAVIGLESGDDGVKALADLAAAGRRPDAVVADLVMNGTPGYDVIVEAKRRFPGCPVIAISGGTPNVEPDLPLELAKRRGADVCLRKPFDNDEFLSALARVTSAR